MEINEVIEQKKEISVEMFKNTPKLISLMKTLKEYGIDTDFLNDGDTNDLIKCMLIVSN